MSNSVLACTRLSVSAWLWKNAKHCTTESKTITANAVFCVLEISGDHFFATKSKGSNQSSQQFQNIPHYRHFIGYWKHFSYIKSAPVFKAALLQSVE